MSVDTIAALEDAHRRLQLAQHLLLTHQRFFEDVGAATVRLCDGGERADVAALLLDAMRDLQAREGEFVDG